MENSNYRKFNFDTKTWDKLPNCEETEMIPLDFSKLWVKSIHGKCTLIIDSFNNEMYEIPYQDYLEGQVPAYFKEVIEWQPLNHDAIPKASTASFILVPSYQCNMSCSYCYQQNDKTFNKNKISEDNLSKCFEFINSEKVNYEIFDLQLFGGEPLLKSNEDIFHKAIAFAKENKTRVTVTTNGLTLPYYLKQLIINRKFIGVIGTTIDGVAESHLERRHATEQGTRQYEEIRGAIKILLEAGIAVRVSMNVDQKNIKQMKAVILELEQEDFFKFDHFHFEFGRVDDRLYETNYPHIIDEVDILKELSVLEDLPKNINAAFIKVGYELLNRFGMAYNQNENRNKSNFCWATNPNEKVYYIDSQLDVYRCTYTVGRSKYKIGNLETQVDDSEWFKHGVNFYEDCQQCNIGGYCSGGCRLSHSKDREKQCDVEKKTFTKLMDEVILPQIYPALSIGGTE